MTQQIEPRIKLPSQAYSIVKAIPWLITILFTMLFVVAKWRDFTWEGFVGAAAIIVVALVIGNLMTRQG